MLRPSYPWTPASKLFKKTVDPNAFSQAMILQPMMWCWINYACAACCTCWEIRNISCHIECVYGISAKVFSLYTFGLTLNSSSLPDISSLSDSAFTFLAALPACYPHTESQQLSLAKCMQRKDNTSAVSVMRWASFGCQLSLQWYMQS